MIISKKLLKLIAIVLMILNVHSLDQCANHGDTCDLNHGVTCCNEYLTCKQVASTNSFKCLKRAELREHCDYDEECDSVWHGKCSMDNKCICKSNYIEINNRYCAPLLNEQCIGSEYCATENSECFDDKCQCKSSYFSQSGERCLPVIIGERCDDDTICSQVKYSNCSKDNICVCDPATLSLTSALCVPLLNVPCSVNENCKVDFSICVEHKCQCKPNYKAYSSSECRSMYLGTPCKNNVNCKSFINNSICSRNKICICDDNYFQTKDGICKSELERSCLDDELCKDKNSICFGKKCHCKSGYGIQGSKCVPVNLVRPCHEDEDCHMMQFAVCSSDNKCVCKNDYIEQDGGICVAKLGKFCYTDNQCKIKGSICLNNQCQCKVGYLNVIDEQCVLVESAPRSCYNYDPNCRLVTSTKCDNNKNCVCTKYKVKINSIACIVSSGEFCTNDMHCRSEYSVCIDNECKCKFEYVSHFDIDCPRAYLGMPCRHDLYCQKFINHTVCRNSICTCNDRYSSKNNKICLPKLNVFCEDNEQCAEENSECIDNKCQCKPNYVRQGWKCDTLKFHKIRKCLLHEGCEENNLNTQMTSSKSCTADYDCWNYQNSRCSISKKICVCKENHFAFTNNSCYPVTNGFCTKDEECGLNFHCVDYMCQCKPNFSTISTNECIPARRLYFCSDNTECSDLWHAKCSNKKCVCNVNNIAINNATCLPILGGYCWRDDQCMAGNSICHDFHCECKPNFLAIANNLCVPKN